MIISPPTIATDRQGHIPLGMSCVRSGPEIEIWNKKITVALTGRNNKPARWD